MFGIADELLVAAPVAGCKKRYVSFDARYSYLERLIPLGLFKAKAQY